MLLTIIGNSYFDPIKSLHVMLMLILFTCRLATDGLADG